MGTQVDASMFLTHKRMIGTLPTFRAEVAVFVLKGR